MYNKKGLTFSRLLTAIVLVGVVVSAWGVILTTWDEGYGTNTGYDLEDKYDSLDEVSQYSTEYQNKLTPEDNDPGSDFEAGTFRGAYGIITNIFRPFRLIFGSGSMIDSASEDLGLPDYIRLAGISLFIFAIVFAIIAIIFRLGRSSA